MREPCLIIPMSDTVRRWLPRILIVVLAIVFARGILPFVSVEGDEQGVINGVIAAEQHRVNFLDFSYIYPIQPGSFLLLHAGHACFGGRLIAIFGALTAVGATAFIVVTSFLGARLCQCRPAWVALALLSCQEMVSAGWYANTCAIAAPFAAGALLIGLSSGKRTTLLIAAALIAIGAWIRMDSLLITPAFLPLAFAQSGQMRAAFLRTAGVAAASGLLLLILLKVSGTSLGEAWSTYITQPYGEGWISLWHRIWLVGSISFAGLVIIAIAALIAVGDSLAIVTAFAATLPAMLVYGHTFTTTKYLYYPLPFIVFIVLSAAVKGISSEQTWPRIIVGLGIAATAMEGLIGVRSSSDEFRRFSVQPAKTLLQLELPRRPRPLCFVFGEGEVIGTDDAFRVRTGWYFAGNVWHREKEAALAECARIAELAHRDDATILTTTYLATRLVTGELLTEGAERKNRQFIGNDDTSFCSHWHHGAHGITQVLINDSPDQVQLFAQYAAPKEHAHLLFINDRGGNAAHYLGISAAEWTQLSPRSNGLLAIYIKK